MAEIAASSREQASGIEQVNKAVTSMDTVTQQNAALVEEATAAAQALTEQATNLTQLISRYDVRDDEFAAISQPSGGKAHELRTAAPTSKERRATGRPWTGNTKEQAPATSAPARKSAATVGETWKSL